MLPSLRIFWQLFGIVCAGTVLSLFCLHLYLKNTLEGFYLGEEETRLTRELRLVALVLADIAPEEWTAEAMDAEADRLGQALGLGVTILAADGIMLGDSTRNPAEIAATPSQRDRPEIVQARQHSLGISLRDSARLKQKVFVLAAQAGPGFVRFELPLAALKPPLAHISRILFTSLLIALTVGLALAFFLTRRATHRLTAISLHAQRLAAGDFSHPLVIAAHDEIGLLAASLNAMAAKLASNLERLTEESNQLKGILEGITEGVMVTDPEGRIILVNSAFKRLFHIFTLPEKATPLEYFRNRAINDSIHVALESKKEVHQQISVLIGPKERVFDVYTAPLLGGEGIAGSVSVFHDITQIRYLEGLRQELVANVSHEFKTPLTAILGYAETLLTEPPPDPETARRFAEKICKNASHLKNLVDDVLQVSHLELGMVPLHIKAVDLGEIIAGVLGDFQDKAKTRTQALVFKGPQAPLQANIDRSAWQRILTNLIDNALKYTPEGGTITIEASDTMDWLVVRVSDTGIGIPIEDQPRIFERFYRVDKGRSRNAGGTGLGLAIVKHLVQAHSGSVEVESAPQKGSVFTLKIPKIPHS